MKASSGARFEFLIRLVTIAAICIIFAQSVHALTIPNYDPEVHNLFESGFNTENPIHNASIQFLGQGYDWSGVGWNRSPGDGSGDPLHARVQMFGMLSPQHAYSAAHYALDKDKPWDVDRIHMQFVSPEGGVTNARLAQGPGSGVIYDFDRRITKLAESLPASGGTTPLRLLDTANGNYTGMTSFLMGSASASGATVFADGPQVVSGTVGNIILMGTTRITHNLPLGTIFESGDSGAPQFVAYKGELTLAGANWLAGGTGSSVLPTGTPVYSQMNRFLAADGYAIKWAIYDVPDDAARTANTWNGGGGSGAFASASNWSKGEVPAAANGSVVFDASVASGQHQISLGADQDVRGILFRQSEAVSGFTFLPGSRLTVGGSGIRNEDEQTQIFDVIITLGESQNWEAVNGDLVFNRYISNSGGNTYLIVVGGEKNTTINGTIAGRGGLAKDDAGTLFLNGQNLYQGKTFIHNGTVRLGIDQALPELTEVIFDAANPGASLDLNGHSVAVSDLRSIQSGEGTVKFGEGGTLRTGNGNISSAYAGTFTGTGTLVKEGTETWTLKGDSSGFTGSVEITAGTLVIANASGSATGGGDVLVRSGAILSGNGALHGPVTLNAGAILTPGTAQGGESLFIAGGLLLNGGSVIRMDLNGLEDSDSLDLGGAMFQKGTGGAFHFEFATAGVAWEQGIYTLIKFGDSTFSEADFSYSGNLALDGGFILNADSLQFQIVPEPSAGFLMLFGLVTLLSRGVWLRKNRTLIPSIVPAKETEAAGRAGRVRGGSAGR